MPNPWDELGISCPLNGKFYVCQDKPSRFMGCCTINPCTTSDGVCPERNLEPTTFDSEAYEKIMAQECVDGAKSAWYTCRDLSPPFMGCCAQNACQPGGCPLPMIRAAKLSSNAKDAEPFLTTAGPKTTTMASTTSTSLSTSVTGETTAAVSQTESSDSNNAGTGHAGLGKGAIAGIAAAGGALGALILGLVIFYVFSRRKKKTLAVLPTTAEGQAVKELPGDSPSGQSQETKQFPVYAMQGGLPDNGGGVAYGQGAVSPSLQQHQQQQQHLSMVVSELPATPSQRSINSAAAAGGGAATSFGHLQQGRESAVSGLTVSNYHQSPPLHQSPLFELEDSSHRFLKDQDQGQERGQGQPGHA